MISSIGKNVKNLALKHCWWQCKMAKPLKKTIWKFFKRINTNLTYDPAILLDIYLKELKAFVHSVLYVNVYRSVIQITKNIPECIKKMCYFHKACYNSAIKLLICSITWINLKHIILSARSQKQLIALHIV